MTGEKRHSMNRRAKGRRSIRTTRPARSSERFYSIVDTGLPFRLTFVSSVILIAVVFAVFAVTCFAAVNLASASERLSDAKANAQSCSDYYAAESTAVRILNILAADDGSSLVDKNGELKYRPSADAAAGDSESSSDSDSESSSSGSSSPRSSGSIDSSSESSSSEDSADSSTVITISRNGGSFSFDVPVNVTEETGSSESHESAAQKNLHVIAQITEGKINIIEWYLKDSD